MRFTNLSEARHIGASRWIAFAEKSLETIMRRVSYVRKNVDKFRDWREACTWVTKEFDMPDYGCEEVFIESTNLTIKQAREAVSDFTDRYGKPNTDLSGGEEIYTWGHFYESTMTVQVFVLDEDVGESFIIVFHDFGMAPEMIKP